MALVLSFLARNWLHIVIAAALAFTVYKIDQNGYERAERAAQKREQSIKEQVAEMEKRLGEQIADIDTKTAARISEIDKVERTIINPTITKEIASDPRFSDPSLGITDGMRDAIERARSLSSGAPGVGREPVPARPAAD